jgi:hypothetical protein
MDTLAQIHFLGRMTALLLLLTIPCARINPIASASEAEGAHATAAGQREFFQQKILPVLQSECYSCHSSTSSRRRGGLALDSREAIFAGGSSGPAVKANDPTGSTLIQSLKGQDGYRSMPPRAALDDSVIVHFETWIRMGTPYPQPLSGPRDSPKLRPFDGRSLPTIAASPSLFEDRSASVPTNCIDKPILAKLNSLGIQSASPCSDSVFVRRVYLDVIGTLPAAEEVTRFFDDNRLDKRSVLIDELLQREEFADYWSLKWCDLFRVKSEFPINLWPNAAQAYHRWVRSSIRSNKPYDRFVREILTSSGSNFRVPQVNFYRAIQGTEPETVADTVALTFMGSRTDRWPEDRRAGMAAFFAGIRRKRTAEWKEEIIYVDLLGGSPAGRATHAILPDGTKVALPMGTDHRQVFADWLIRPENPWFTGCVVNRIWYWMFGTGIVHEPDDVRRDNPATNPELLAVLRREFVESEYDLKHIYRLILNSAAYQRSCLPTTDRAEAEAYFAHYPLRRLDAEVLIDAICQITGTTESYSSLIPEPWTFIPGSNRSISLADGSITSPFLELFGRPPRNTGFASERANAPNAAQKLHLLNSSHINDKIEARATAAPETESRRRGSRRQENSPQELSAEAVTDLYLRVVSRYPTGAELDAINQYAASAEAKGYEVLVDLTWALINTSEFLYRH